MKRIKVNLFTQISAISSLCLLPLAMYANSDSNIQEEIALLKKTKCFAKIILVGLCPTF